MSAGPERPSFVRLATRGALWTGAGQYVSFALGVGKAILLARLVGRPYFGLVAGAAVWASYLGLMRVDLRLAVLRSEEEPDVLETQFALENLSALAGFGIAGVLAAVAPGLLAKEVWVLIFVLLGAAQFEALTSTSAYLAEKRLRQDAIGRLTAVSAVLGFAVPVGLAWSGLPLPALAVDAVLPLVVPRLGAAVLARWRPSLVWHPARAREQVRLAWTMWTTGLLGKVTFQFDDWLVFNLRRSGPTVWRSAGVEAEALYDRAYGIGKLPMDLAAGMIASNALALYVEGASRGRAVLAGAYRRLTWLLAWVVLASGTFVFVAADDLVHVLGDAWVPMVPLLRLMILFVLLRPFFQNNAQVLLADGGERDVRRSMLVQAVFLAVVCPAAVHAGGAAGAAVAVSAMSVIGLVVSERDVARRIGAAPGALYLRPGAAGIVSVGLVTIGRPLLPSNMWASAGLKGIVTAVVFGTAVFLFDRDGATESWALVRRGLKRP
jgi:O-antigen/teichoic acid export membrane protein